MSPSGCFVLARFCRRKRMSGIGCGCNSVSTLNGRGADAYASRPAPLPPARGSRQAVGAVGPKFD